MGKCAWRDAGMEFPRRTWASVTLIKFVGRGEHNKKLPSEKLSTLTVGAYFKERNRCKLKGRTTKTFQEVIMRMNRVFKLWIPCTILGVSLVSCTSMQRNKTREEAHPTAKAEIQGFLPNTQEGTVWFTQQPMEGLRINGEIKGLLPNHTYAMHIHEFGSCANPQAAGEHFDPGGSKRHGMPGISPGAHHAGDLPNIRTDADGVAKFDFATNALGTTPSSFSVVGRSIVIHSNPDDYTSQPAGATGPRLACGVIERASG
jgi:superoxide dismutase, Cu-Zn family